MPTRPSRPWRRALLLAIALVTAALAGAGSAAAVPADAGGTPILGPAQLSAEQIARAFGDRRTDLSLGVAELAGLYLEEGAAEGVRGDLAFAQAVLETGWFAVWGDVPPGANNYAGIGASGGGAPGHVFATPRLGVRAHVQHLRFLADPRATPERLAHPPQSRWWLVDPPGKAPTLEQLSGCTWACDPAYASKVLSVYRALGGSPQPSSEPAAAMATPAAVDPRIAPRMPDGLVVRAHDGRLWWLAEGSARPIRSPEIAASWGLRPSRIVPALPGEVARRRPGPALDWRPGTLLRLPDASVALYDGEALRPVDDPAARGYRPDAIVDARPGDVAGIDRAAPLAPDALVTGEVVRYGDDVFEVADDGLLRVDDPQLVYARYGGGAGVASRPADAPGRPPVVGTVAFRDGTLLRTADSRVWLVAGGQRRHITSPAALAALDLPVGAVLAVDDELAARHDVGSPLDDEHLDD